MNLDEIKTGMLINVQAYKYDGTLYRQWNGVKIVEVSDDKVVLLMLKTKVDEIKDQKWVVREPTIWFFPLNDWFNTLALLRKQGTFYYTNLASKPIFEDGTIKYVDFDLDVKDYPDKKTALFDNNEFRTNIVKYKYPQNLVRKIDKTTDKIFALIRNRESFFNEDVIKRYIDDLGTSRYIAK